MRLKALLLGVVFCVCSFSLFAADGDPAGQVIIVAGPFRILHANNVSVTPRRGDTFYSGDTLITGRRGTAQVRFTDGGVMALTENSQMKVNQYHYEKNSSSDKSVATLVKGGFRALTGLIAKEEPSSYKIQTPVAVIGVRGTNLGAVLARGKLFTGVWKGNIIVENTKGTIQLGEGNDYNYSEVSPNHAPVGLLHPPAELAGNCLAEQRQPQQR
jgi:hypothetical protein